MTLAALPWGTKALFGSLSDSVPLCGYTKRGYIIVSLILLASVAGALANVQEISPRTAAGLFCLGNLGICIVDLLMEGKYSELMRTKGEGRSDIVTYVWLCCMGGGLLAAVIAGPLADQGIIQPLAWGAMVTALFPILPLLCGWLPEDRQVGCCLTGKMRQNRGVFGLALIMSLAAFAIAMATLYGTPYTKLFVALGAGLVLLVVADKALPPILSSCNMFMFIVEISSISLGGALQYFFIAPKSCLDDGPHFSYVFFTTWAAVIAAVFGLLGLALFQWRLSHWNVRNIFYLTTVLRILSALFDIAMVERWNTNELGIDDHTFFVLGDAIISPVISMISFLPMVMLTSKLCSAGLESTTYSILAGFQNLGSIVSRSAGSFVIAQLGMQTETCPYRFDNLGTGIAICNMAMPLLVIPFARLLLPNTRLDQPLYEWFQGDELNAQLSTDELWHTLDDRSSDEEEIVGTGLKKLEEEAHTKEMIDERDLDL
jgi:folate/biopterin transporter